MDFFYKGINKAEKKQQPWFTADSSERGRPLCTVCAMASPAATDDALCSGKKNYELFKSECIRNIQWLGRRDF